MNPQRREVLSLELSQSCFQIRGDVHCLVADNDRFGYQRISSTVRYSSVLWGLNERGMMERRAYDRIPSLVVYFVEKCQEAELEVYEVKRFVGHGDRAGRN